MKCQHCDKDFAISYMYTHQRVCLDNPTKKRFACSICDKTYTTKTYLTQHIKKHTSSERTQTGHILPFISTPTTPIETNLRPAEVIQVTITPRAEHINLQPVGPQVSAMDLSLMQDMFAPIY